MPVFPPGVVPRPARARARIHVPAVEVPERRHDDGAMLFWQVRGGAELVVDGERRRLRTGEVLWVPAGIPHRVRVNEDSVLLPLFFDAEEHATTLGAVTRLGVDQELRVLLLAYLQTEMSIIQPSVNIARQLLAILERALDRPLDVPMPAAGPARIVADALRFNPGDDRTVVDLAATALCSPRTLERAFAAETGMTLRRWRIAVRIESAMMLLRSGAGLGAVAHRVGYADVTAFRRAFKAHTGETPGSYAARFQRE